MGLLAGETNYTIIISTATTGAAGSEEPDYSSGANNGITLYAEKYQYKNNSADKKNLIPSNKAVKILTGKMDISITLVNCVISKVVGATSTAEMDAVDNFIYSHGRERGGAKVYLFLKNGADGVYRKLSWSSAGVHQRYIKGYFGNETAEGMKGKLYRISQLVFEQVT